MSGHSKWHKLKHKKGAIDQARGKVFSKIVKEITVAARLGGEDPSGNPRLRLAIEKAKQANMPGKNVENAVKRGAGTLDGVVYEEIAYEAYAPGGVGLMIQCLTDNKNRTVAEIRATLTKNGGNLAEAGAVGWQFEKKGIISVEKSAMPDEEMMMSWALEDGAEDVIAEPDGYTIKTTIPDYIPVLERLKARGLEIADSEIGFYPKNQVPVDGAAAEKIETVIAAIDDLDDVQSVASNITSA